MFLDNLEYFEGSVSRVIVVVGSLYDHMLFWVI